MKAASVPQMPQARTRNGLTTTAAGVPLDRAAVTVLLELADSGAMRPGELAARLEVEAPHVTRQVQLLEKAGYAARGADPDDRRPSSSSSPRRAWPRPAASAR
jgi:DNA-binding MarR family transcriptional regulator